MALDPETTLSQADRDLSACFGRTPPPPSDAAGADATRTALEDTLACLDDGAGALACASGRAAAETVTHLLGPDAHLLCARDARADTAALFSAREADGTLAVSYVDATDRAALTDAVRPTTEALWVASPSAARLRVYDLEALAAFADAHDLLLIVDNTGLSPVLQRPLEHGADLVVYTSSHHLTGQSDVDGGAVVARSRPLASALQTAAREHGTTASAFDSWLLLRDAKTLPVRVRRHETNARSLAYDLREHPAVDRVFYPGLRGHPDHETARAQQDGYGHLVSFVVDPDAVDVETLIAATALFRDAAGIGGTDSRICRPDGPAVPDGLVRLSIGIEATADLADDLAQALDAAHTGEAPTPSRPSGAGTRSSPCARAAAPSRP